MAFGFGLQLQDYKWTHLATPMKDLRKCHCEFNDILRKMII